MNRLSRREVWQWLARAGVAVPLWRFGSSWADAAAAPPQAAGRGSPGIESIVKDGVVYPDGYGRDPDVFQYLRPWALTLNAEQIAVVARLCDALLPEDSLGPAASSLGIPAFVDEWISAPYPEQQADRQKLLYGIEWLEQRSAPQGFLELDAARVAMLCDRICDPAKAAPEDLRAAVFFDRFRYICLGAYYTTEPGMKSIGYVGYQAFEEYPGVTPEVLRHIGLE